MSVDIGLKLLLGVMFAATLWFIVRMDVLKQERLLKELELTNARRNAEADMKVLKDIEALHGIVNATNQKVAKLQERADLGRLR